MADSVAHGTMVDARVEIQIPAVDYATTAWYKGCDGDLAMCLTVVQHCYKPEDVHALTSEALVRCLVTLLQLHARLRDDELPPSWTPAAILEAVLDAIPLTERTGMGKNSAVAALECTVAAVATEVLTDRVALGDVELLTRWESHVATLWPDPAEQKKKPKSDGPKSPDPDASRPHDEASRNGGDAVEDELVGSTAQDDEPSRADPPPAPVAMNAAKPTNGRPPKKGTFAEIKWQLHSAVEFHRSYRKKMAETVLVQVGQTIIPATAANQWTQEITDFVESTLVTPEDETHRTHVAAQIQDGIREAPEWKDHEVLLFGSSVSKFGSNTSDLDMCLRAPATDSKDAEATPSSPAPCKVDELNLEQLLDKSLLWVDTATKEYKQRAEKNGSGPERQSQFLAHWKALTGAIHSALHKREGSETDDETTSVDVLFEDANAITAAAEREALRRQKMYATQPVATGHPNLKKIVYALAGVLGRCGCSVTEVVPRGRVPVVRFTHTASGFDCDLCLENYQACVNTQLLRTYAEYDDRVRQLGMAIKYWAKQRRINDAGIGYLSSYSYIMLVIYFLQRKVRFLPSLQDPELLREANVAPTTIQGVDMTFCADVAKARAFHTAQLEKTPTPADLVELSVGEWLVPFFRYYVDEFNFGQHVVTVRLPHEVMGKRARWGRIKCEPWRMSIEDPFEPGRDLGCVLVLRRQLQIVDEMKRALQLLRGGQSFMTVVCEAAPQVTPSPKKAKSRPATTANKATSPTAADTKLDPKAHASAGGRGRGRGGDAKRGGWGPRGRGHSGDRGRGRWGDRGRGRDGGRGRGRWVERGGRPQVARPHELVEP